MNGTELKCTIERDRLGRIIYRAGDGVGVVGSGPLDWLSENAITPKTKLFHFFVIGDYIEEDDDYVILESIKKGTAVGRLSWYSTKQYTVFRMNDPDYVALGNLAAERASIFGRRQYDYAIYLKLFTWAAGYWLKEIATGHIPPRPARPDMIPYKTDRDFICIELYFAIWNLVGRRIRAHGHAPVPAEVIEAVHRGTLVVIDHHNGDVDSWRTPRGRAGLSWATLGRVGEDLKTGDLAALGTDGLVRKALVAEPEIRDGQIRAVSIPRERLDKTRSGYPPGPDLIARPKGQKRNRIHVYRQPYGYPIRVCDWVAQEPEDLAVLYTGGGDMTLKNFIYSRNYLDEGQICRHCWAVLLGDRTSFGMDNHGHGKGAPC